MINLWFDIFPLVLAHAGDINFTVEVSDITNDGFVFHLDHVIVRDHVDIAGGCYENIGLIGSPIHRYNTITFHGRLERTDGINFNDPNLGSQCAKCLSTTLAHIAVADDDRHFAGDHDVCCTLNAINE